MFDPVLPICRGMPGMMNDQQRPLNYIGQSPGGWASGRRVKTVMRLYRTVDPSATLRTVLMYQPFGKLFVVRTIPSWWKARRGFDRV